MGPTRWWWLATLPVLACGWGAREVAPVPDEPAPDASEATGGQKDSVGLRGHWTIEVRDPDGTTTARREFDNAYVDPGFVLGHLLAGERTLAGWMVVLNGIDPDADFCTAFNNPWECTIIEPIPGLAYETYWWHNLVVTVDEAAHSIELQGSAVATYSGTLQEVRTGFAYCFPGVTDCGSIAGDMTVSSYFTIHALSAAEQLDVAEGQQILVTFTLQFSGA